MTAADKSENSSILQLQMIRDDYRQKKLSEKTDAEKAIVEQDEAVKAKEMPRMGETYIYSIRGTSR